MIQETKDLVRFICHLGTGFAKAEEDGKITLGDIVYFPLKDVGPALDGIEKVPAEIVAMTPAEADELAAEIDADLGLGTDKVKLMIEEAVKALPHLIGVYRAAKL